MEMFYPVDLAMGELNPRLPVCEIQGLNQQMNCNLEFSEESETYFEQDNLPEHVSIVDEMSQLCWDAENIWN